MEPFVFLLLGLAALNLWMSLRVWRAGPMLDHKALLIAGVWIAPFIGAFMVRIHLSNRLPRSAADLPPPPARAEAPRHLEVLGQPPLDVEACLRHANGWLVFDWTIVNAWLDGVDDARLQQAARLDSQRSWLMYLRDAMGDYAWLHETDDVMLLSTLELRAARATAESVTLIRSRVGRVLGSLAAPQPGVKSILVVFDDEDDYYRYTAAYEHAEGELAFSGGMFIDAGCPHFVTRSEDLSRLEPVIAHELTHAALAPLRLPVWLDEGLAVNTEHRLTGAVRGEHTPQQLQRMHQRFWGEAEIQQFWTGESFRRPDDGNKLSYDLARIIVEQLAKTWEPFAEFVAQAAREDAGARAARDALGIELGALVCALLQREPAAAWSPLVKLPAVEHASEGRRDPGP